MAKTVSQGGELFLVKRPSVLDPDYWQECVTKSKKGRVCVLGPLSELIKVQGVKAKVETPDKSQVPIGPLQGPQQGPQQGPPPAKKSRIVVKSVRKSSSLIYQQYQLDIKGLLQEEAPRPKVEPKPKDAPDPGKAAEEPGPAQERDLIDELQRLGLGVSQPAKLIEEAPKEEVPIEEALEEGQAKEERLSSDGGPKLPLSVLQRMHRFKSIVPVPLHSIPKLAVLVKWKQHPNIPCYTTKSVFDTLSTYGSIAAMGQLSINSCLVLFDTFRSAIRAVQDSLVGPRAYPLICKWYYSSMYTDSIDILDIHPYKKQKIISEEAKWLHRFREMQNQVITCFKIRCVGISYDRSVFIP